MKQGFWSVVGVLAIVGALVLGFFAAQAWKGGSSSGGGADVERLSQQLLALQKRVEALEQAPSGPRAQGSFKVAYVDMFGVLEDLYAQQSDYVKKALEQFRAEKQKIDQQAEEWTQKFQRGEITRKQLDEELNKLKEKLTEIDLKLTAPIQQEMFQVIREIGDEKGYSLIIDNPARKLDPIVLYSQAGTVDDITQEVVARLTERLKENENK